MAADFVQPLFPAQRVITALHDADAAGQIQQPAGDLLLTSVDAQCPGLQDQPAVVAVHQQAGQVVALAVDQAVGGGCAVRGQPCPAGHGCGQPAPPEVVVDGFVPLPAQQPHLNLAGPVQVARGQPLSVVGAYIHNLPVGGIGG